MHFENLLFILLIAMAALLRLLATKAGEAKKRQKTEGESTITPKIGEPIKRVRVESDQERIRKFLEALVPQAMADAFRSGNFGVMDYVRMKNVQADTSMRESIAGTEKPRGEGT